MQQIAGFTPQTPALGPQSGSLSIGHGAMGLGYRISQQEPSRPLPSAPPLATSGEQSLSTRSAQVLPSVESRMLQALIGVVDTHWEMSRFNMDVYQQAVDLEVQLQGLKDDLRDLLQAGVVEISAEVSDKTEALCEGLEQLRSDHAVVQEHLGSLRDYETQCMQQLSDRTEQYRANSSQFSDSDRQLPVQQGDELQIVPEAIIPQMQSTLLECDPDMSPEMEIQPQQRDSVESEIFPHMQERPTDQTVHDESRVQVLDEPNVELSALSRQSGSESPDSMARKLLALSQDEGVLAAPVDDHFDAEHESRYEELEEEIVSLSNRCDELQVSAASSELEYQAQVATLITDHQRELGYCRAAQQQEITDLETAYQERIDKLQQELHDSRKHVEDMKAAAREDGERLQMLQDEPALNDKEIDELRKAVEQHVVECAQLREQNRTQQLSYEALLTSHQADVDQMTSAHQGKVDQLQQEYQAQIHTLHQSVDDAQAVISNYKSLLEQKSHLVANSESTLASYETQLRAITAVAEKLASSFTYVDTKHDEIQQALDESRGQLSGVINKARGLTGQEGAGQAAVEGQKTTELMLGLEVLGTNLAGLQGDVDDVQAELAGVKDALRQFSAVTVEPTESSAADESDIARTRVSVGRRAVEV